MHVSSINISNNSAPSFGRKTMTKANLEVLSNIEKEGVKIWENCSILKSMDKFSCVDEGFQSLENGQYKNYIVEKLLNQLDEFEQKAIKAWFGFANKKSKYESDYAMVEELAEQKHVSREYVRQIKDKAIKNIQQILDENPKIKNNLLETI